MKKIGFKISALLLAFTMLFSTLSFSVNKHYCGDMLFSQTYFSHAEDCGMQQMDLCGGENSSSQTIINNSCCQNVQLFIKGQTVEQKALVSESLESNQIVCVQNFKSFDFKSDYQQQPAFYQNYTPPLLVENIPVLVQSFLI
ncbi:MAG: hypothetical protein HQ471_04720 [Flavobacteriales bacterium]|nr:hypothetical protein [Flavobacteriales bacterium]